MIVLAGPVILSRVEIEGESERREGCASIHDSVMLAVDLSFVLRGLYVCTYLPM